MCVLRGERWMVPLQEGGEQPDPKDPKSQGTEFVGRAVWNREQPRSARTVMGLAVQHMREPGPLDGEAGVVSCPGLILY